MEDNSVFRKIEFGVEHFVDSSGRLHNNDDCPARISVNQYGQPLKEWYNHGFLHRDNDLPAFSGVIQSGTSLLNVEGWFQHGLSHRERAPSAIEVNLSDGIVTLTYSVNGKLSRDDGPAIVRLQTYRKNVNPQILNFQYWKDGKSVPVPEGVKLDVVKINTKDIFEYAVVESTPASATVTIDQAIDRILKEEPVKIIHDVKETTENQNQKPEEQLAKVLECVEREASEKAAATVQPVVSVAPTLPPVKRGRGRPKKS